MCLKQQVVHCKTKIYTGCALLTQINYVQSQLQFIIHSKAAVFNKVLQAMLVPLYNSDTQESNTGENLRQVWNTYT